MKLLEEISEKFKKKEGIYFSEKNYTLSYPKDGNDICYELEEKSFWFQNRNNIILNLIDVSKEDIFLDLGGGNGFVASILEKNGYNTLLLEPGIEGVKNAKKRGVKNIICGSLDIFDLLENKVNAIGIFDVLEHIEDDEKFLQSIQKKLEDSGKLYITVPAFNFLWAKEDKDAGHYRRYNKKNLKEKLLKAGYKVNYISYFFSYLVLPIFLFRTVPSFFIKKEGKDNSKKEHTKESAIINYFSKLEQNRILKRKKILFGSSIIVEAEKI